MNMPVYRHELKFLCDERQLYILEDRIRHICRRDVHVGDEGLYLVKSLYFDTYGDRCYHENLAGVDIRKKYRIRIYNNDPDTMKLECKYSRHNRKAKESCRLSREQYNRLMDKCQELRIWKELSGYGMGEQKKIMNDQNLLGRFLLEKNMELLEPKVIVEYERTPYVYAAGNVRITFDRAIRSSAQVKDFPKRNTASRSILPEGTHIMEVKYDEVLPAAILGVLVVGQELQHISFSKYTLCRKYAGR